MQCHARGIDNRLKEMLHQLQTRVVAVNNLENTYLSTKQQVQQPQLNLVLYIPVYHKYLLFA
jgi:hypothetical protein